MYLKSGDSQKELSITTTINIKGGVVLFYLYAALKQVKPMLPSLCRGIIVGKQGGLPIELGT